MWLIQDHSADVLDGFLFVHVLSFLYLSLPLTQGFFVSVFYCFLNSEVSRITPPYWFNILKPPPPFALDTYLYLPVFRRFHSPFRWLHVPMCVFFAGSRVIKLEALIFRAQLRLVMCRHKWHHSLHFMTVSALIWFHGEIRGETLWK